MLTKEFLYAGRAVFTISNNKGEYYTFKVEAGKNYKFSSFFVKWQSNNGSVYLGMIKNDKLVTTKASKLNEFSKVFQVFDFAVRIILGKQVLPEGYRIYHVGMCGKMRKNINKTRKH